jgi:hypothetical protein
MNIFAKLFATLILISPSIAQATLFAIDSQISVVHTTNWSNWPWNSSLPDDLVDLSVQGTFEVAITPSGFNPWTGEQVPDKIMFTNINVITSSASNRSWSFPEFMGFFFGPDFEGSSNPCFGDQYTSPGGSCWSAGNFGQYQGTYDGHTIIFTGGMDPDWWSTNSNGYMYEITAVAVPEPTENLYLMVGLALIFLKCGMSKNRHPKFTNL